MRLARWKRSLSGQLLLLLACACPALAAGGERVISVTHDRVDVDALWESLRERDRYVDPVSEQGQHAHGLYFNGPTARRLGSRGIARMVRNAGLNAAVIDLKDEQGRITYDTHIETLKPQARRFVKDMPAMLRDLRAAGVYTIGRIACFSDPQLPRREPDRAVMDGRPGKVGQVWGVNWGRKNTWLDPYNVRNHDLIVELTREAQAIGIDEVQLDYIRFPVDDATQYAVFPAQVDTPRREVLLGLLARIDEAITIPLGTDVFGLTAFREGDPAGLGQVPELWARHVEVFSHMLYVNGMRQWVRGDGEQRAMRLINAAMKNLRRRLGHGPILRPFMQAFPQGADYYDANFIAEQVRGARSGGADGFLFWHPGSNYGTVRAGILGPASGALPFPIDERIAWRRQAWADRMSYEGRRRYLAGESSRPDAR